MADPLQGTGTRRWRALAWLLALLVALTALYALAGFVLLPRLARQQLIDYGAQTLQAQVHVGAVRFNPFTLRAQVSDFSLSTQEAAPLVRFARLEVDAALSSLWHGVLTLRQVQLEQPTLELAIDRDGTLNWAPLSAAPGPGRGAEHSDAQHSMALRIEALQVRGGRVHFEDRSRSQPFSAVLDPIELDLINFRSTPEFRNRLHLMATTTAGERLDWNAEFSLQPFASSGELQLSALKAATIAGYLQDTLPFALRSGSLDAHASYHWSSGSQPSETVSLDSVALHEVAIAPHAAAGDSWIKLPELQLSGAQVDLLSRRVQVRELRLEHPAVHAWREPNEAINLVQLMASPKATSSVAVTARTNPGTSATSAALRSSAPTAPSSSGASSTTTAPWELDLGQLKVEDGTVALEDRSVQPTAKLRLSAIGLQLQGFSSAAPKRPLTLDLTMHVGDSGQLHVRGDVALTPSSAHLKLDLQRLDLTALQPYLARQSNVALYRGNLSAQAQVSYGSLGSDTPAHTGPLLDASGDLSISDLAARERVSNSELLNWQLLELSGVHYQQQPDALSIKHITLRHGYGRVLIGSDGSLNITQALHSQRSGGGATVAVASAKSSKAGAAPEPVAAAASSGKTPTPIRIDRIDISGGTANFTDQSVRPTFSAAILSLRGSVVGLSSEPQSRAQVHLSGLVERYAPVSIDGQLNLLSATAYTDLSLNFSNIDLTLFNPYSGKFAGYSIAQGKLATQMHYHVEDRKLQATHHIEIDQLEFGPATADKPAVPLPIKLGAALLKDRHGVISIDLPVSGSIDDPNFHLGPLIRHALLNLLTKVVTAPFSWLGSLIGGGEQLAYVDFSAGSAEVRDEERQKIERLAKALVERPQLKLDVPLHTVSAADDGALAHKALEQAAAAKQSELSAATQPKRARGHGAKGGASQVAQSPHLLALEALYQAQFHAAPVYPAEVSNASIGDGTRAAVGGGGSATPAAASPSTGTAPTGDQDLRASWLERQLLGTFLPNAAQREALGRARADAVEAAVLAAAQLPAERIFLTNRLSGGGPAGMSRMELQLQ